ncbi:hypothetical protein PGRAN_14862 [Listeria grandensis FSL F6-0971]|uniref:Uncharacterized protein n=1 Tax=Listeria grandensis FSL F6-0971 TaxID=1265819 RepID=W7AYB8_9LIST|nr:hypothetical protein PGRAN_14862 [Listeria grandensis FSL F6-0971]
MVTHDDYDGQLFCQTIDENIALIREQNIVQEDILIEEYTTIKNNAKKIEKMINKYEKARHEYTGTIRSSHVLKG